EKQYYVYDFWNDRFVGLLNGGEVLEQDLRPGEARMMSIHAKKDRPQFISTNRHLMQGFVDLRDEEWDAKKRTLSGVSAVVEGDPYTVVIATNGLKAKRVKVSGGKAELQYPGPDGLISVTIRSNETKDI